MNDLRVPYAVALAVTAIGLAACGDDGDGGGEAILIKTLLTVPVGDVLPGSHIADSALCRGGSFRDEHGDSGAVVKTFRCPDGRLTITFRPLGTESCARQSGPWRIVDGSGRFEELRGHGRMTVRFRGGARPIGHETFTGTVTR